MVHDTVITVRFGETDALGHVNNTSYFIYLEEARIKFFETFGYVNVSDWTFVVASIKCDFVAQAFFNQKLKVTTVVSRVGTKSFQLEHDILDYETGKLVAKGHVVMVNFDFETQESREIPDVIREQLNPYLIKQ